MSKKDAAKKGIGFLKEFKDFISKGNVIDLAVGVIIGGAFSGIVTNLVTNIITPVITLITGKVAFTDLFVVLGSDAEYATLAAAQEAGASTLNYGLFIQAVIDFIITAFVIFLLVKGINKVRNVGKKEEAPVEEAPTTKVCPFCKSEINIEATRCPNCTSEVE
ncbi:MAG: large conductance mechanosensitive channel protein MscL [Ruminococcaceae bacterium]|nr:large conductance mechanosensitive channel protein MscL [Oscillospiraceae bacterium]